MIATQLLLDCCWIATRDCDLIAPSLTSCLFTSRVATPTQLCAAVDEDSEWEVATAGEEEESEPLLMQYNDPFTLPWKRRNEVALPVRARAGELSSASTCS